MKAWILHGINDLRLEDIPKPIPKPGEVLVEIKAAGICSSDLSRVFSTGAYHYPIILGHEFSGVTEDGRRVGVFPLLPCFNCESCQKGEYETCSNYSYIGSRQNGAFAEYVSVPEWNLIELPENISFEQAAMLEPVAVALHAVKRLDLTNVSTVAVVGNGTMGRIIAKWLEIFEVSNVVLLGKTDNPIIADAYFEVVGSVDALRRCIENVKPNGQIILVGNPEEDFILDRKTYWQILRRQIIVQGVWNSRYPEDWCEGLFKMEKLNLDDLISRKYHFEELSNSFKMIHSKKDKYYKVMIIF